LQSVAQPNCTPLEVYREDSREISLMQREIRNSYNEHKYDLKSSRVEEVGG